MSDVLQGERLSYWALVRAQFAKNRPAVFGMWSVLGLFVLATIAPLLAMDQPFVWDQGEGLHFPFFGALFNRLLFENGVDLFFNLLLILSPLYLLAGWWLHRKGRFDGRSAGAMIALHLLACSAVIPDSWFGVSNPLHRESPIVDYRALEAELEASGSEVRSAFPLRKIHYRETNPERSVLAPGGTFLLGTDLEGRDVFVRMIYGTRISLTIGVVAVAIYVLIGVILGAMAGYYGGWVDVIISRLIEVMICIPSFFLILTLVALVQDRSIFHVMIIIGVTSWTGVARLVRAEFLQQRELEYVLAAQALGLPRWAG